MTIADLSFYVPKYIEMVDRVSRMSRHFLSTVFYYAADMFYRPTIRWTVKSVQCKGKVSVLQVPSNVSLDEKVCRLLRQWGC